MPALYVIRHGEPAVTGLLLGRTDPPLSDAGHRQMESMDLDVAVIYTSELQRARKSAEIVARLRPVVILSDLMEMSLGDWDGKSWPEIEREYPETAAHKLQNWTAVTPPAGEAWDEFTARVDRAMERIRSGPLPAAVVAHLTVNSWIAHRLTGADPLLFEQQYGQCYEYRL